MTDKNIILTIDSERTSFKQLGNWHYRDMHQVVILPTAEFVAARDYALTFKPRRQRNAAPLQVVEFELTAETGVAPNVVPANVTFDVNLHVPAIGEILGTREFVELDIDIRDETNGFTMALGTVRVMQPVNQEDDAPPEVLPPTAGIEDNSIPQIISNVAQWITRSSWLGPVLTAFRAMLVLGAAGQTPRVDETGLALEWHTVADGDTGVQGDTGTQGIAGPKGDTGSTGSAGTSGAAGSKGDTGITGSTGAAGSKGDTGATGGTGAAGGQGDTGAAGDKGDTGTAGGTGGKGDTGTGDQGDTGAAGASGAAGGKGDTGAAGSAVDKGDTGTAGSKGDTGSAGENAIQKAYPIIFEDADLIASCLKVYGNPSVTRIVKADGTVVTVPMLQGLSDLTLDFSAYQTYYAGEIPGLWTVYFNVDEALELVPEMPAGIEEDVLFTLTVTASDLDFDGQYTRLILEGGNFVGETLEWAIMNNAYLTDSNGVEIEPTALWIQGVRTQEVKILTGSGYEVFRITTDYRRIL